MATLRYVITDKDGENDRPKISIRLRIDDYNKIQTPVPGILVNKNYWKQKTQKHVYKESDIPPFIKEELDDLNDKLSSLKVHMESNVARTHREDWTKEWLAEKVDMFINPDKYAPKEKEPLTLLKAVDAFIEDADTRIIESGQHKGKKVSKATQIQYKQMRALLRRYFDDNGISAPLLADVNKRFYDKFVSWLYDQGLKMNTIGKHVKNIKVAINALPTKDKTGCEFITPKRCVKLAERINNIYLNEAELQVIEDLDLSSRPTLDRTRDLFLLLCWTGQRFSDLHKLSKEHMTTDSGCDVFKLTQQKTEEDVCVPILPPARRILEKYAYNPPVIKDSQVLNRYIKQVAKIAGLTDIVTIKHTMNDENGETKKVEERFEKWQLVSSHTGRRCFVSNMLARGFDAISIARITGHKSLEIFIEYDKTTKGENAARVSRNFK